MKPKSVVTCRTAFQQWDTDGGVGDQITQQRQNKVMFISQSVNRVVLSVLF